MENQDTYENILEASAKTRLEIDAVLSKRFSNLRRLFKKVFVIDPVAFKRLNDLRYYKGGYPSEDTPPKIDIFVKHIGDLARVASLVGDIDLINEKLDGYGFKLVQTDKFESLDRSLTTEDATLMSKTNTSAEFSIMPDTTKTLLSAMLDTGQKLQADICSKADSIKVTSAALIEKQCNIKKANFLQAVRLRVIALRKSQEDMEAKVGEFKQDKIINLTDAISTVDPDQAVDQFKT